MLTGPPRSYPEHAVAFYHVAGKTIDEDQVTKNFGEGMTIIRHDFGQQYAKQKIAWDASKWSRDGEPQPKDFTSVRGIVIGLVPHDQPLADEDDHDSHLEYIVILNLDVVFDESRTVEDVVRDAVVHRNSFHRSYDEKTRRFISKIDTLETQVFKDAVEKDKWARTP